MESGVASHSGRTPGLRRVTLHLPTGILATFILLTSSIPSPPTVPVKNLDKLWHFLVYFLFSFFIWRSFSEENNPSFKRFPHLWVLLSGAGFSLLDEFHQEFIPGRSMDFFDWLADLGGIVGMQLLIGGVSVWRKIEKKSGKKLKN